MVKVYAALLVRASAIAFHLITSKHGSFSGNIHLQKRKARSFGHIKNSFFMQKQEYSYSRQSSIDRDSRPQRNFPPNRSDDNVFLLNNPKELVRVNAKEPNTTENASFLNREKGRQSSFTPLGSGTSSDSESDVEAVSRRPSVSIPRRNVVFPSTFDNSEKGRMERKGMATRRESRNNNDAESREMGRKSSLRSEKGRKKENWDTDDDSVPSSRGGGPRRFKRKKRSNFSQQFELKIEEPVRITSATMTVSDLASMMNAKPAEVVKYLMINMGIMATVTQSIDANTVASVAEAFGKKVIRESVDDGTYDAAANAVTSSGVAIDEDDPASLLPRPPVVTIMGHVDHGKTSLLDAIRSTKVAVDEAGGITQAVGAYQVQTESGQLVTFIDTPGHAAFSEMRSRGANVTDVVVLVVAADDGIKEQTVECIATAKAANVPIVVAINKMDKSGADPSRVLNELMKYDLLSTEFGGDVEMEKISAKKKVGLDELLEKILLQAEVLELKANPNRPAQGTVIEAEMKQGLGTVATTLIQRGTLNNGDIFVAGSAWGKVKFMMDHTGKKITTAGPSVPVQVVGIEGVPNAGDAFMVVDKEDTARLITESRRKLLRESLASQMQGDLKGNLEALFSTEMRENQKEKKELSIVIRADGPGSAEAIGQSLKELVSEDEYFTVSPKIVMSGVGELTKSDVAIAGVSNAFVICFNVGANHQAVEDARRMNIEIGYYNVVYNVLDTVQAKLDIIRSPKPDGIFVGRAVVKAIFSIGKVGNIAGCEVVEGEMRKGSRTRVMRMGRSINEGKLKVLRNVKADVESMVTGTECGIQLTNYEDFEVGDLIECYIDE